MVLYTLLNLYATTQGYFRTDNASCRIIFDTSLFCFMNKICISVLSMMYCVDIIDYMLHHFRIDCIILLIKCWICKLYFDSTRIFTNSSVIVLWLWRLSMVIIACCWSWVGSCHKHGSIWNYQNHCQKYHYQEIIAQVIASVKCRRWKI